MLYPQKVEEAYHQFKKVFNEDDFDSLIIETGSNEKENLVKTLQEYKQQLYKKTH